MNVSLIIRLLLAHIVSDFMLQSNAMCEGKKALHTREGWKWQCGHAAIHAVVTYLFVAEWACWALPFVIFGTHLLTDVAKAGFDRARFDKFCPPIWRFVIDQWVHLLVLAGVYTWLLGGEWPSMSFEAPQVGILLLAGLLVLKPTSVFVGIFFRGFGEPKDNKSLEKGGTYIGYLERILIVSFILGGWPEGIGYLIAAKSVFRFGDLKNNKDLKHTEYILLGTFLSFTIAVLAGLLARWAMTWC